MKTLSIHTTNDNKADVEVYFNSQFSGHGHYKILCYASYENNKKTFTQTTNDMPWIDSLSSFKEDNNPSFEQETQYYLDKFEWDFEERINEWIDELFDEKENE